MNAPNPYFKKFVTDYMAGDRRKAARQLGVSVALIGHVMTGRREVSIPVTQRIEFFTRGGINRHDLRPDVFGAHPLPNNALPIGVPNGEHPVRDANNRDHVLGAGRSK